MTVEERKNKRTFIPPDPEQNPLGHMLADYAAWLEERNESIQIEYDEEFEEFQVTLEDALTVTVYPSEIDGDFYEDDQAVFVEAEIAQPDSVDLEELLTYSGDELVLSRISQTKNNRDQDVIVVEAALPLSKVSFSLFDLMVKEVASIAADIKEQLQETDEEEEKNNLEDDDNQEPEDQ